MLSAMLLNKLQKEAGELRKLSDQVARRKSPLSAGWLNWKPTIGGSCA